MALKHIFSDESGCFTFKRANGASTYFMVCTATMDRCDVGHELLDLKRELAHDGTLTRDAFHATTDSPAIRDRVFSIIENHNMRVDVTILEKSKAQPQTRRDEPTFYKYAWYYHFRHVGPQLVQVGDELAICAAALRTNKGKASFKAAVNDVAQQVIRQNVWSVSFPEAATDPCLQVADYCAWAIQRKWERGDDSAYNRISAKINTEFDLWAAGTHHYY
ncbi:DUF3800 domain-containing protein [Hwanghaeella sp.]|uniref:DUF3800 domain-containing protein n=1 Tax=Hwanghaeella sp. TaxID=2605943 RepID=UPI003CCC40BD